MFKNPLNSHYFSVVLLITSYISSAQINTENRHNLWNGLVSKNVVAINNGHSTEVDYVAMQEQHSELKAYLDVLTAVTQDEFNQWKKPKQLAFLINAYNAWTVELILTKYPKLKSIKDLGGFFSSPWSQEFVSLLGEKRSLDNIEHDLIRGSDKYNDPRIHFALNCASVGCPALRNEAYTANELEVQLQEQTVLFLSDKSRNSVKDTTLSLSPIFKWYRDDFEKGFNGAGSLAEFILHYSDALILTAAQKNALKNKNMKIKFSKYNWDLNERQ